MTTKPKATKPEDKDEHARAVPDKSLILAMLDKWVRQRPGLDFANYGDVSNYRSELRSITRDLADYRQIARHIELRDSITAETLVAAFPRAFSGRLTLTQGNDGKARLEYCTGQYWPTEYRKAACAVLASVLWDYVRTQCMPKPDARKDSEDNDRYDGISAGDWIRRYFAREFGRGIARRWFS